MTPLGIHWVTWIVAAGYAAVFAYVIYKRFFK